MIESLTVLTETRGAIGRSTFAAAYTIGARPLSDEQNDNAFGELRYTGETSGVRIDRTPKTEADVTTGSHVEWRGSRWRVDRRVEAEGRTRYDLLLARAA